MAWQPRTLSMLQKNFATAFGNSFQSSYNLMRSSMPGFIFIRELTKYLNFCKCQSWKEITSLEWNAAKLGPKSKWIFNLWKVKFSSALNCPLGKAMTTWLDKLQREGRFILTRIKILAITDCAPSSPKFHGEYYSFNSINGVFFHCRFVNQIYAFPDLHAAMRASNAAFSSNPKLKILFINSIFWLYSKEQIIHSNSIKILWSFKKKIADNELSGHKWRFIDDR